MQKIKSLVTWLLNSAVRRYIRRNGIKVIVVAGSVGKTSTTNAIRTVLAQKYRVHRPVTAYNTSKSVHIEMFDLPFATSAIGWIKTTLLVLLQTLSRSPYDVLVVEIGTDHPGELHEFAWLQPEIGVLTAIVPEHMEYFKTIEAVAAEELSIADFCRQILCNANAVERRFVGAELLQRIMWYGSDSEYSANNYTLKQGKAMVDVTIAGQRITSMPVQVIGEHSMDALLAAAAVAKACGMRTSEITHGLQAISPVKGRMQLLTGWHSTTLIDDSYNSSPEAAKAALDVLYGLDATQRVAVMGTMNEMGGYSERAHREVGAYCDPAHLDLLLTVGADANDYLATEAAAHGCRVERFTSPYAVGAYLREQLQPGASVLFKGSQNGVFAEEAIKSVLANPEDTAKLVRQSPFWMKRKAKQFKDFPNA